MSEKIFTCEEHVDMALDDYVNIYENAPEISKSDAHKCSYCEKDAVYMICEAENFL